MQEDYLSEQIRSRIRSLYSEHFNHTMINESNNDYPEENETLSWIHETLKRIYLLILAYLELKGLTMVADTFRKRYEDKLEDPVFMLNEKWSPLDEARSNRLSRLDEFEDFLLPFHEFDVFREEKRISGSYLENILKNTGFIIKRTNTVVTNETSIYKAVLWFIEILFPESLIGLAPIFPGKFKKYKPDLHVPELQTAIEYKYIREGDHPEDYIDEVLVDAKNYKGDDRYQFFIAVLYFENNTEFKLEAIESCWKQKNFPATWKLVVVFNYTF